MRERISRELIVKKGFRFIAIEGDWPDAARVDNYVRHLEYSPSEWTAFARLHLMWRNNEVRDFVNWLRAHNAAGRPETRAAFHGLDLHSLYVSIGRFWIISIRSNRMLPRLHVSATVA